MQKIFNVLLLLSLTLSAACTYSGLKLGLDIEFFKVLKLIDFNKFVADMVVAEHEEISGTYLFDYDAIFDNVTIKKVISPTTVDITHTTTEGQDTVHLFVKDFTVEGTTTFQLKFGIFKESGTNTKVVVKVNSFGGTFYFKPNGTVEIPEFVVNIGDVSIDFDSGFIKFIYALFKSLIISKVEGALEDLRQNLTDSLNQWVNNEFLYDLGFGIGFNLTNIDRPKLVPFTKNEDSYWELFGKLLALTLRNTEEKEEVVEDNSIQSSYLECGIHGSVYPNLQPTLQADIPPAVDMKYISEYFDNEIQFLISDYTLNTLLYMAQQTGFLHQEFTTATNDIFPFEFNVNGLSKVIPEFKTKYPNDNFEIEMKAYVKIGKNKQPIFTSSEPGVDVSINFGLEFLTTYSDDPFDDPDTDLQLNITGDIPISFEIDNGILSINIGNFKIYELDAKKNLIKADLENLKNVIETNIDEVVFPLFAQYIKEVNVTELLKDFTGVTFTDLRLETKENYIVLSIGIDGLN